MNSLRNQNCENETFSSKNPLAQLVIQSYSLANKKRWIMLKAKLWVFSKQTQPTIILNQQV